MISVIIPALNEGQSIGGTIDAVQKVLNKIALPGSEIVVVDDGSTDNTGAEAYSKQAKVVRHPHNVGYGRSLKDGIRAASNDCIVIIDADLTYPVEAIPELFAAYGQGFDMVVGARTGKHYAESIFKTPLRHLLKILVEFTAGRHVADVNSGLRIFSRKAIMEHFDHLCDTFSFTTSMTLAYMMTGRFVKYVPIGYNERVGSSKVRLLRDSLRTLQYITQAMVFYNPLKVFVLLSAGCIAMAVLSVSAGILSSFTPWYFLAAGSVLLSILMFGLGLIGNLFRQIHIDRTRVLDDAAQALDFSVQEGVGVISAGAGPQVTANLGNPVDRPTPNSVPVRQARLPEFVARQ
jgi:polyisoprenyl-phosphate glycosyltransferase